MDSNIKTLVIDDDEDICDILKQFLESSGYTVDVAMSGKEAIQTISEKTFDVAITDLDLGDMSGLEVIKSIKQLQPTAEVIMLSGYGKAEHASEAIGLGASAYIQKPITFFRSGYAGERGAGQEAVRSQCGSDHAQGL